jgi:hypothetical protein
VRGSRSAACAGVGPRHAALEIQQARVSRAARGITADDTVAWPAYLVLNFMIVHTYPRCGN